MLFSNFARTDSSPKRYRETNFEFIDRSADPEVEAVRRLVEQEFAAYLDEQKLELKARLQSRRSREFHAASFELLLYGLLRRKGYRLEAHPHPGNGSGNRPDFLVTSPEGDVFFLEAVLAAEVRELDPGSQAMKEDVLDALDRDPHPDFYLDIIETGEPATQPPVSRLRKYVHRWLNTLNADQIKSAISVEGHGAAPRERWAHEGWEIELCALPKYGNRGQLDRLIGMLSFGGGWVDLKSPIREAIRFKGGHYGDLPLPLVVAVNVEAFFLKESDEVDALFGSEVMAIHSGNARLIRQNDGAWHDGRAPRSARVSAAWICNDLSAWSIAGRRQTLYINPWATNPLGRALDWLPVAQLEGESLVRSIGPNPGEIYGLR